MKSIIEKTIVALMLVCATGGAWAVAPTPTVVWDGDFSSLTKTVEEVTYTIENVTDSGASTSSANSVGSDKSYLQVANSDNGVAAPIITATGGEAPFGSTDGSTVLIFVSNMPTTEGSNRALLSFMDNTTGPYGSANPKNSYVRFGIARAKGSSNGVSYGGNCAGGFISAGSIDVNNAPVNINAFTDGKQSIALTYKGPQGYFKYYVDGQFKGEFNPGSSFTTPTGICIGGLDYTSSSWFYAQKSMKIHTIAIFDRELTADEIAEYESQSKWRYCDAIAWRNASGDFHQSTYAPVSSISATASASNTRTYNTAGFPWNPDLRIDAKCPIAIFYDTSGKQQSVGGDFSNLYIGGLNVTATPSSGTIYTLTGKNANGTRETMLGDKTGNHESWFVFDESYTISRPGAADTASSILYGTVNMQIAGGKTFSFNSEATTAASNLVMTAGTSNTAAPQLKMIGAGQFTLPHLNASTGKLDYSALNPSSQATTPFINGLLTVSDNTTYAFPALSGAATYKAANKLSADATRPTTFTIGENEYTAPLTFTASTGEIAFPAVATLAEGAMEVANVLQWDNIVWDATPATISSTTPVVINVTDDTLLMLTSPLLVKSLVFNISAGKTLRIYAIRGITATEGFTVTGGGTFEIYGTALNVTGNMSFSENATLAFHDMTTDRLTVNGTLTVPSGKTLTLAPATITGASATMLTATSIAGAGTIALSAPTESGYTYTMLETATTRKLVRTPNVAFSYDGTIGATPSGWFTAWGGEHSGVNVRVGPNSSCPIVYEVYHNGNGDAEKEHPYYDLTARSSVTLAVYADLSQVANSGRKVIASFGKSANGLMLYRDGDYVRASHITGGNTLTGTASVALPAGTGYHLYTVAFDPTGSIALYLDDGSVHNVASSLGTMTLDNGFQIGGMFQGLTTNAAFSENPFGQGVGTAFAAIRGYDAVLEADHVAKLSESFPATSGNVTWDVLPNNDHDKNYVYNVASATFGEGNMLGISHGTLNILSGATVNVGHFRALNTSDTNDRATVNIAGTLNVTSTTTNPNLWAVTGKGILLGHWKGEGEYNVTGSLLGANTYLQLYYTAGNQVLNINGGLVSVKGLYAFGSYGGPASVNLTNDGVLEVKEVPTQGSDPGYGDVATGTINYSLGYGTYRALGNITHNQAISFTGTDSQPTTLDPNGYTFTLDAAALTGSGYIKAKSSAEGATKGTVSIGGSSVAFSGTVVIDDDGKDLITFSDISGYYGKILYKVTGASSLPAWLDGFTGTLTISGGTVDARTNNVDLSGARVVLANGATLNAVAGKEGAVTVAEGTTLNLYVSDDVYNYEGHVFDGTVEGTIVYYHGETPTAADSSLVNSNNLLPYYRIFLGSGTTGSLATGSHWQGTPETAPTDRNAAFKVANGATLTVTIDGNATFGEVQIYGDGSGTVIFVGDGEHAMTVTKGIYVTGLNSVEIQGGVDVSSAVVNASGVLSHATINCGTAESPYVVSSMGGLGEVVVAANGVVNVTNATVTSLTVNGVLNIVGSGVVHPTTLSVGANAQVNVASTASLIPTAASGSGTVVWNGTAPNSIGWQDSGWKGVNWVKNATLTNYNPNLAGNSESVLKFTGATGTIASGTTISVPVELVDDESTVALNLDYSESLSANTITFSELRGSGTFKTSSTNDRYPRTTHKVLVSSQFTGSVNIDRGRLVFGSADITADTWRYVYISSGAEVTVSSSATWTSREGFYVYGTLNVNGTLSSSATQGVQGNGTVVFTGRQPTPTGDTWWKTSGWSGTVWVKNFTTLTGSVKQGTTTTGTTNLNPNDCGRNGSVVKFTGVKGYMQATSDGSYTINPTLELEDDGDTPGLLLYDGWGYNKQANTACYTIIRELKGNGTLKADPTADGSGGSIKGLNVLLQVLNWGNFTGTLNMPNKNVVFGSTLPAQLDVEGGGKIFVRSGATVTIPSSKTWTCGTFYVDGTLSADSKDRWSGAINIGSEGKLKMTSTGNFDESNGSTYDYSGVTGTGTIEFNGTGWRGFPNVSPADTLSIVPAQRDGLVFRVDKTIGSLSGSGNLRTDLGNSKDVTVKQAKDGVWSGCWSGTYDRLNTFNVCGGASSVGTLTLAGQPTHNNALRVCSASATALAGSVNLTGSWVGAATIEEGGTFGGVGTVTSVTFNDGSIFKVFETSGYGIGTSYLTATGGVTVASGDVIWVETAQAPSNGMVLMDWTAPEGAAANATPAGVFRFKDADYRAAWTPTIVDNQLVVKARTSKTINVAEGNTSERSDTFVDCTIIKTDDGKAVLTGTIHGASLQIDGGTVEFKSAAELVDLTGVSGSKLIISANVDLREVTTLEEFLGTIEIATGARVTVAAAVKDALVAGHGEGYYKMTVNKDGSYTLWVAPSGTVIQFVTNDLGTSIRVPEDGDGVVYVPDNGNTAVKIDTKPITLDDFTGMNRVTPFTLSLDVTIPEEIDYTGYGDGFGPVLFSYNLGPNEVFVMRKSNGVMAARFNETKGDSATDYASLNNDNAATANKVLELGKSYHIDLRYWGALATKDGDTYQVNRGFGSAKTGTTVFVDGVEDWHHNGLRWGSLTLHRTNNIADGYTVTVNGVSTDFTGTAATQEPLADAKFHENMMFPTNIVIGAATKATRTGERVFKDLVVHGVGFMNLAGFYEKAGVAKVDAALPSLITSDNMASYWYDYGITANSMSGGYALSEQTTYGVAGGEIGSTYSRGVVMSHKQSGEGKFTITLGVSIPSNAVGGTICEIPMNSGSITVTYDGATDKFALNGNAQTEAAGDGAHVLVLTYDTAYGAYLWVDSYDEDGNKTNATISDAVCRGKTLSNAIYFGSGAAATSSNGFFAGLGVAHQNVQFGYAVCDEADVETALKSFDFGPELASMPLSMRLKCLANISPDGATIPVPTITIGSKVLTGYEALSAAMAMGIYTNYVTSLSMSSYDSSTGNMACEVDPNFAGKMSVSLVGSTNNLVWTRLAVSTIAENATSVSLPLGSHAFGNGGDYRWFKILEEPYTNNAPVEVGRIHEKLADRPTTDFIFKKGETGWNQDVYRIPAMAATPDGQTVMGIFDARYCYQDLGVPLDANGNGAGPYDSPNHYTGIDIGGVFSLDAGENWSYPQVMIDVPNASNPQTGAKTTTLTKDMELGDPSIVYDSTNSKFIMMGITGGGLTTVHNGAEAVDVVTYECTLESVKNGAPKWTNRTSVKQLIEAQLNSEYSIQTNDYKTGWYGNGYMGILQGPGHAFVTRAACGSIPAGTVVWPMQYVIRNSGIKGGNFAAWKDSSGNWHATKLVPSSGGTNNYVTQEGCITQLDNGYLLYMCKNVTDGTKRPFYVSSDGVNWTYHTEITGLASGSMCQGSMLRLGYGSDGNSRYAAVFATGALRSDIKVYIGTDTGSGGITWDAEPYETVWAGATGTADDDGDANAGGGPHGNLVYGYNSLVMLNPTTLGVLFEAHGHIYFTKVDVSSVLQ